MANLSAIKLPNGTTYNLKDNGALQLTGGSVTGPVSFGDSVSIDEATIGDLVVNGSASFTNNLQANTINGVTVGSNPKFTDTNTVTTATTTGSGNAVTAITASNGALTVTKGTTFLTSHQDISGKADKSATVSTVTYDSTNKKITKTINGTTSDVVTVATLKTALGYTASDVGALPSSTTYVSKITTTAGAHTAISNKSGAVSFNVPTTAAHVGIKFGYTTSGNNRAVQQDSSGNLYVTQKDNNSNTTYTLTNALSSHKFTWTLTAGGSGSGSTTTTAELVAGSNVTLTDDTTNKKITIAATDTTYSIMSASELSTGTATTARTMSAANTKAGLLDLFYPVGSYYETSDTTFDPNVAWGGTWVKDSAGKVTVAQDTEDEAFDTIGDAGGVKDAIVPAHTHTLSRSKDVGVSVATHGISITQPTFTSSGLAYHARNDSAVANTTAASTTTYTSGSHFFNSHTNCSRTTNVAVSLTNNHNVTVTQPVFTVGEEGDPVTDKNLQPYVVVNRWHRTA